MPRENLSQRFIHVLQKAGGEKAKDIQEIRRMMAERAASNAHITAINASLDAKIRKRKQSFTELTAESRGFDQVALFKIRKAIRVEMEQQARVEIQSGIHDKISFEKYKESLRETARILEEENRKMQTVQQHEQQKEKTNHMR